MWQAKLTDWRWIFFSLMHSLSPSSLFRMCRGRLLNIFFFSRCFSFSFSRGVLECFFLFVLDQNQYFPKPYSDLLVLLLFSFRFLSSSFSVFCYLFWSILKLFFGVEEISKRKTVSVPVIYLFEDRTRVSFLTWLDLTGGVLFTASQVFVFGCTVVNCDGRSVSFWPFH